MGMSEIKSYLERAPLGLALPALKNGMFALYVKLPVTADEFAAYDVPVMFAAAANTGIAAVFVCVMRFEAGDEIKLVEFSFDPANDYQMTLLRAFARAESIAVVCYDGDLNWIGETTFRVREDVHEHLLDAVAVVAAGVENKPDRELLAQVPAGLTPFQTAARAALDFIMHEYVENYIS